MKKLLFVTLITLIFGINNSYARSDKFEIMQSDHCARYFQIYEKQNHMPSNLLRAVSVTESGRWSRELNKLVAWPWTINVGGRGYHYNSKKEAINAVLKLKKKGKTSIDIGCMQINLKYHPEAFDNLEQTFEPKFNIEYASSFLKDNYEKTGSWEGAIRRYHNINPKHSNKYIARIYQTWRIEDKVVDVAMIDSPAMNITVKARPSQYSGISDLGNISSLMQ